MNKKELEKIRKKNYEKLDYYRYRPKINALEIDINNSYKHEKAKFDCIWAIRKGLPANLLPEMFKFRTCVFRNKFINKYRVKHKYKWQIPQVITEARFKNKRRVDIFILDTGEMVEIETGKSKEKKGVITVRI